jgi:anti-anti-sigma factor
MTTTTPSSRKKRGKDAGRRLRIETDLTIYTALATKDLLLAELAAGEALSIDLSAVSEIDTAGLQLLVLASREAAKAGKTLKVISASNAVSSVLALCSMSSLLETVTA